MPAIAFLIVLSAVVLQGVYRFSKARRLVREWAETRGVRIVSMHWEVFPSGPVASAAFGKHIVYDVSFVDTDGQSRRCWAKCGGWWLGLLSDTVEVVWPADLTGGR